MKRLFTLFCALLLCGTMYAQNRTSTQASETVKVPAGQLMGPDPVQPKSQLVPKKAVFEGVERTWEEYVPASYKGQKAVPLVVAVHGGSADAQWMFGATSWAQIADQVGFIVIYPNGSIPSGKGLRWNAYMELNNNPDMAISADNGVDEAKFIKELIEKVEGEYKIDATRIYMHGQSNGGVMASYFGLRYPEMLAAMAPNSAPPSIEVMSKYAVKARVPVYFWGGETDTVAGQYNPLNKSRAAICKEFAEFWAGIDKSDPEPKLRLDGPYNTKIHSGEFEVRNTEFRNGIHTLPFSAAYLIWNDFFSRFARGKNGEIVRLVPEAEQASPADEGAVAIRLGTPFALVGNKVVRIGNTPNQEPAMVAGAPSSGVVVPASFAQAAFGAKVEYLSDSEVKITTSAHIAVFTAGSAGVLLDGRPSPMADVPTSKSDGDIMISLRVLAERLLGKKVSNRRDVYKNDIYYVSDRSADLSAQTITYMEQKLAGKSEQ